MLKNKTNPNYEVSHGNEQSPNTTCEEPDQATEGVGIEYSIDGGTTWVVIQYWTPAPTDPTLDVWTNYYVEVPGPAQVVGALFRWHQPSSSVAISDHWGLDNLRFEAATCNDDIVVAEDGDDCEMYVSWDATIHTLPPTPNIDYTFTGATTGSTSLTNGMFNVGVTNVLSVVDGGTATEYCSFTITVNDVTAPNLAAVCGVPANPLDTVYLDINGEGILDTATIRTMVTDNCQSSGVLDITYDVVDFTCADITLGGTTIEITITAIDTLANSNQCLFYIKVLDALPPVITGGMSSTVECDGAGNTAAFAAWLASNAGASATDNCTDPVTWSNNSIGLSDDCAETGTETVTFTASDAYSNTSTVSFTFTIEDTTPPTITAAASDMTVECDGAGNTTELNTWLTSIGTTGTASDVCNDALPVVWTNNFTALSDLCAETGAALVTFTATDDCGNSSTTSATFTIEDTTPPTITVNPSDETVECDGLGNTADFASWLSSIGNTGVASDVCNDALPVVWTNNSVGLSDLCGATGAETVTFTATDDCGNASTAAATFTIEDTTPPTITAAASDMTVECDGAGNTSELNTWLTTIGTTGAATDVCSVDGPLVWTNDFTALSDDCGATGSALVVFTVADNCGNTSTTEATFTIEDTTAPTITAAASDLTVECDGAGNGVDLSTWLSSIGTTGAASDVCSVDGPLVWTNDFTALSDDCGATGSALVVFTVADNCGNTSTTSATFTILDNTPPTITAAASDLTVECDGAGNTAELNTWLTTIGTTGTATDVCSVDGPLVWTNDFTALSDLCGETGAALVTFTVADNCGNTSTTSATFTIEDTTGPDLTACDLDETIECLGTPDNEVAAAAWDAANLVELMTCASDICGSVVSVTSDYDYTNFVVDCGTAGEIDVEYVVTDVCGNTTAETYTFTIEDTTPPTLNNAISPQELSLDANCEIIMPDYMTLVANGLIEACDRFQVTFTQTPFNSGDVLTSADFTPGVQMPITVTGTDDCGNVSTVVVLVTFLDETPPVAVCQPATIQLDASGAGLLTPADVDGGSFDVCAQAIILVSTDVTSVGCSDVGVNPVVLTVSDQSGNTATCGTTVTVEDNVAPTATCQDVTVYLDANGDGTTTPALVDNGSWDACGIASLVLDNDAFTCGDIVNNPNTVTLTVTDNNGNTAECTANVMVIDNVPPTAICQDVTVQLDANGDGSTTAALVDNGSNDACGIAGLSLDNTDFTCSDIVNNPNTVVLTVTDNNGNTSSCSASVEVQDNVPPVALCQDVTIELDAAGSASTTAAAVDDGSNDACGILSLALDQSTFDCSETGGNPVVLTVTDNNGNISTCGATVTVEDNIPPTILSDANNSTVECDGAGNLTDLNSWLTSNGGASATDNCINVTWSHDFTALSDDCGATGSATVTFTATDDSGNASTTSAVFTIVDTTAPSIGTVAVNETVECDGAGNTADLAAWLLANGGAAASDVCGGVTWSNNSSGLSDLCGATGAETVTFTATDDCGNTSATSATFTIEDTDAPSIDIAAADETVECDGAGNATEFAAWLAINGGAAASDVCGGVMWSNNSTGLSNLCGATGAETVTFTATDECGNASTTSATFTIEDTTPPAFAPEAQDLTVECDGAGNIADLDNWLNNNGFSAATDACSVDAALVWSNDFVALSDDCGATGSATVTFTVEDNCGNTSATTATFTIEDTTPPALNNTIAPQFLSLNSDCKIVMPDFIRTISNDATDACDPVIDFKQMPFDANDVLTSDDIVPGQVYFTEVTGTDACGNVSTAVIEVTFLDEEAPEAICQDATIYLDAAGNGVITPADVDGGSFDNCNGTVGLAVDVTTVDCTNVGTPVRVTLTVTDPSGNVAICGADVTVLDEIAPVAVCQNVTVQLDASGNGSTTAALVDNGSSDACGVASLALDNTAFTCADVGANTVVLTVTDVNGNVSTCESVVTVEDNVAPDAICEDITVQLDATGNVSIDAADVDMGSSDACGIKSTSVSPSAFVCSNVGPNTVTLTVTDNNDNVSTCTATVTVEDNIAPVALCQDITVQLDASGVASIVSADVDNGSNDACGIASMSVAPSAFDCGDVGTPVVVTLTVTDVNGNVSTCAATVTVEDNVAPVALCQDITVQLDATGNVSIDAADVDMGSSDACGIALSIDESAFTCSNVGTPVVVTLTVTDPSGNASTCTSTVTVEDNVAPVAVCQDITVELDVNGEASIVATDFDGGSTDACGIATLELDALNQTEFDCDDVNGVFGVTLTVTDVNGNASACAATVTVVDVMAPVIVGKPLEVTLYENGEYVLTQWDIEYMSIGNETDGWTVDNCTAYENMVIDIFPRSFECIHVNGPVPVTISATDEQGNTGTFETTVLVHDVTPPVMECIDAIEIFLDDNGEASIFPGDLNDGADRESTPDWARTYNGLEGGSYDACGIDSAWVSTLKFNCSHVGVVIDTLWMKDPSHNTSFCTTTVTVRDTLPPRIQMVDNIVMDVAPGVCEVALGADTYPDAIVTGNCGFTLTQTAGLGIGGLFPLGTTTETWVATDGGGNSTEISFDITITTTNAAPTIDAVDDVTVDEDTPSVPVALAGISAGGDCDAQTVAVVATATNGALVTAVAVNHVAGSAIGSVDLTIAPEMSGTSDVTVTVTDSEGAETTQMFVVTVTAVNDAPFLVEGIADQMVNASIPLTVTVSSVMGVMFDDIDDATLAITVMVEGGGALPAWITIDGDDLIMEPLIADTGSVVIVVTATDADGATATDTFTVTIDGYPVSIDDLGAGRFEVVMYPNPTRGAVNLKFNSTGIYDVKLAVLDITGKIVLRQIYSASEQITFDMSDKVSGMYFVQMEVDGKQIVKKLMVDRN